MSWNGSSTNPGKTPPAATPRRRSNRAKCFVAVVIVAIFAVAAWFFFRPAPKTPENNRGSKNSAMITDVKPALSPKTPASENPKPVDPNARPTKVGEMVNGYVMLPSGRIHRRVGAVTNSIAQRPKPHYHIFKHKTDNEIASYLSMQPGDTLIGTRRNTGNFKKFFLESLKEPIIVTSDDTPEQAKLKRDVNAARQQLKDALDHGEDIEQIMIQTRNELQDLMRVKNSMRKLFNEEVTKCKTEQDVDDMLTACNKMLAEKGIAPLKCGYLTRMNILRNNEEESQDTAIPQNPSTEGEPK